MGFLDPQESQAGQGWLSRAFLQGNSAKGFLLDAIKDPKFRSDLAQGLLDAVNRGAIAGTLGGPVDLLSMALRPFGYKDEKPVGGSEWIGDKMRQAGIVSDNRNPLAEGLASVAVPAAVPSAGRAVYRAEQALAPKAMQMAQDAIEGHMTRSGMIANAVNPKVEGHVWINRPKTGLESTFIIPTDQGKGVSYVTTAQQRSGKDGPIFEQIEDAIGWKPYEFSFRNVHSPDDAFGVTGSGNAAKVMSEASSRMLDLLNNRKNTLLGEMMYVTASEPSRVKLYDRMMRRMSPSLDKSYETLKFKVPNDDRTYFSVVKRGHVDALSQLADENLLTILERNGAPVR